MIRSRDRYVRCQVALVLNEASALLENRGAGTITLFSLSSIVISIILSFFILDFF